MPETTGARPATGKPPEQEMRVSATIRMLFATNRFKEALTVLRSMIERIRLAEGCLSCRLYRDVLEKRAIMIEQLWSSEISWQRHLRTDESRTVLLVVEMASEPPEIRFDRIARSTGIGMLEKCSEENKMNDTQTV